MPRPRLSSPSTSSVRTETSEKWELELREKIYALSQERIKEAKARLLEELAVEGVTDSGRLQKIMAFKMQMVDIKAQARQQYKSALEQERFHLQRALRRRRMHLSSVSPVPSMAPTVPTSPSLVSDSFSTPETISQPLSPASEISSLQQYQRPHAYSQPPPPRKFFSQDTTSVPYNHYSVTARSLVEDSEPVTFFRPPPLGRTGTDIHGSPSPSPSTTRSFQHPQIWKPSMTREEDAAAESYHRWVRTPPRGARLFGPFRRDSPWASNRPSPLACGSEGRTLSEKEREQREVANRQGSSTDSVRAAKEPPQPVVMDRYRSSVSGTVNKITKATTATQPSPPPASLPFPDLSIKPSIKPLQNLKKDQSVEDDISISATRPTEPAPKRYSYLLVSDFIFLIFR
jgi:hypothetical protein